jgi:hypothetical protein
LPSAAAPFRVILEWWERNEDEMTRSIRRLLCITALLTAIPAGALWAQTHGDPEEFTAFAVNMGALTGGGGSTAQLIININRWSSGAERDELFTALKQKGQEVLLERLRHAKSVGTLRTPNSIGYDLRLALDEPGKEGGRRVLVVTDRPVGFNEATARPQSIDYPFTVIDMQIPAKGFGQGTMSIAAKIIPAGRTVLVENFDTQPVQLNHIEAKKRLKR